MYKNNLINVTLFCAILLFLFSCTKDNALTIPDDSNDIEATTGDDEVADGETTKPGKGNKPNNSHGSSTDSNNADDLTSPPSPNNTTIEIGNGSGDLTIDGRQSTYNGIRLIFIKAGSYNTITVRNLEGQVNSPIEIKNSGEVTIRASLDISNISNVTFSGGHNSEISYGFIFKDISYRAIILNGKVNGLTLQNLSFQNVKDYVIFGGNSKVNYQGDENTRTERLKILNSKFNNVGSIWFDGNLGSGEDRGFVKDVEIAHNIFENTNWGILVQFSNVQDYNVHHNIVNNVNANNNEHNGIFLMAGNGKFHNNKFTNYQGNALRAWVYSRGSTPATIEIYNNIMYNSQKYGAFEIQGFSRYIVPGVSTHVNAKVYNNTVGKMNTSKDWEGVILDLYNYGGTLEYYNNLGFELYHTKSIGNMINNYSDVNIIKNQNNKYFSSFTDAVTNLSSFSSKHLGIGASL